MDRGAWRATAHGAAKSWTGMRTNTHAGGGGGDVVISGNNSLSHLHNKVLLSRGEDGHSITPVRGRAFLSLQPSVAFCVS